MSSTSLASLRISRQMSSVKMVEEELKMEVSDDMRAAIITASIMPLWVKERTLLSYCQLHFFDLCVGQEVVFWKVVWGVELVC